MTETVMFFCNPCRMLYGIDVPNLGLDGDPATLARLAAEAEAAGWDAFFVWDALSIETADARIAPTCDTWVALTAAALATRRIRLGPMICPVARRRPRYAEAGATWWIEGRAWQTMWQHPGDVERVFDGIREGPTR